MQRHQNLLTVAGSSLIFLAFSTAQSRSLESAPQTPKMVVAFVDLSISAQNDRERYRKDLDRIAESLGPGDRLVVAPITGQSLARFETPVDEELPLVDNSWNGNELLEKRKLIEKRKDLQRSVDAFWQTTEHSKKTAILDMLPIAQELFNGDKRRRILIFFSDMLEDSERYNFERIDLSKKKVAEIIKQDRERGVLPNLKGVHIYVAGASAATEARYKDVEAFWTAYFDASGADCHARYAHTLINFSE